MSDLAPTTVCEAGPIMAAAIGLSWAEDRVEVVGEINRYRNHLYNLYPRFEIANNVFHCICITKFPERCTSPCCATNTHCWSGFALPPDVAAVEAAWEYGYPLLTRSRWREMHVGKKSLNTPRIEVVETGEQWPTERPLTMIGPLMMFAESAEDEGKSAVVEAEDDAGVRRNLVFTLEGDGWVKVPRHVRRIYRVALPSGLTGSVTLAQADGRELGIYAPWEVVPSYRLFRVANYDSASRIEIQGTRRYTDVYFDSDVVECGDRLVIEEYGAFRKYRLGTTDAKDLNRAEYSRTEMETQLAGVLARHRGNAVQDPHPFGGRNPRYRKPLPGLSR